MTTSNINYSAVLADLEARKAELEAAIATIKGIVAAGGGFADGGSGGAFSPDNMPVGAFLRLSIADATKKFLDMVKTKQTVPAIIKALEQGGLPPAKYTTVYSVLRRRESQFGDIIRVGDEWALTEWYPNNPKLRKQSASKNDNKGKKGKAKATTKIKPKSSVGKKAATPKAPPTATIAALVGDVKTHDAAEQMLTQAGQSLDLTTLAAQVNANFGKRLNANLLKGLLANDSKHRFADLGGDVWDLSVRVPK
ncbi:MAG: hypothetical protein ACKVRN_02640 [Pyrinomonadaceae bacterium]